MTEIDLAYLIVNGVFSIISIVVGYILGIKKIDHERDMKLDAVQKTNEFQKYDNLCEKVKDLKSTMAEMNPDSCKDRQVFDKTYSSHQFQIFDLYTIQRTLTDDDGTVRKYLDRISLAVSGMTTYLMDIMNGQEERWKEYNEKHDDFIKESNSLIEFIEEHKKKITAKISD